MFDFEARAKEKELSRKKDEEDLASGKITKEELSKKNNMFHGMKEIFHAKIRWPEKLILIRRDDFNKEVVIFHTYSKEQIDEYIKLHPLKIKNIYQNYYIKCNNIIELYKL